MRTGEVGREGDGETERQRERDENINPSTHTDCTQPCRQEPTDGSQLHMAAY